MKEYIKAVNRNIPIILQGNKLVEFDFNDRQYHSLYSKKDQFVYNKIINKDIFYKHYDDKFYSYFFGKGIIKRVYDAIPCIIFCEEGKIVVSEQWTNSYPSDFRRFKVCLKENGINARKGKNLIFFSTLEEFIYDPLAPSFNDYQENYQREVSEEFILSQKLAIISSEEENIVQEEFNPLLRAC